MNLIEMSGPQFLAAYLTIEVGALSAGILARTLVLGMKKQDAKAADLDGYDVAYLNGGRKHAFLTAVAALTERGGFKQIDGSSSLLARSDTVIATDEGLERRIYESTTVEGVKIQTVLDSAWSELEKSHKKLVAAGLAPDELQDFLARMAGATLIMAPCIFVGIPKLMFGMAHGKPIGFLFVILAATAVLGIVALATTPHRTKSGDDELRKFKSRNASLESNLSYPTMLSGADVVLAYALFGGTLLSANDPFNSARRALAGNSGSGSAGGCGGGSCGGGCGGCGGCGG